MGVLDRLDKPRKVHRINNLTVRYKSLHGFWHVLAPDGTDLDYFRREEAAIKYAKRNKRFLKRRSRK